MPIVHASCASDDYKANESIVLQLCLRSLISICFVPADECVQRKVAPLCRRLSGGIKKVSLLFPTPTVREEEARAGS